MAQTNVQAFSGDVDISSNLAVDTSTLFVDSVGNKVGIGITNPSSSILDVAGTLRVGTDSTSLINLGRTSDVATYRNGYIYHDGTNMRILNQEDGTLQFGTNNDTNKMTILANGNVGIGTNAPGVTLDVAAQHGEIATPMVHFRTNRDGNSNGDGNVLKLETGGNRNDVEIFECVSPAGTRFVVRADGNVGIGTNAPGVPLEVFAPVASGTQRTAMRLTTPESATGTGCNLDFIQDTANVGRIASVYEAGSQLGMSFSTWNSGLGERVRIDASGNVGIGTAGPSAMLDIFTGSTSKRGLRLNRYTSGNYVTDFYQGANGLDIKVGHGTVTPSSVAHVERFSSTSARLRIESPGNIRTDGGVEISSYNDVTNAKMIFDMGSRYRMFSDGDNKLLFSSAGGNGTLAATTALSLNGTNVGIGTTQPSHKLHVNGNGYASGGFFNHNQQFYMNSGVTTTIYTTINGAQGWIWAMGNDYIYAQARYSYKAGWQGFYFASIFNSRLTTWTNNGQNIWARHDRGAGRSVVARGIHMGGY